MAQHPGDASGPPTATSQPAPRNTGPAAMPWRYRPSCTLTTSRIASGTIAIPPIQASARRGDGSAPGGAGTAPRYASAVRSRPTASTGAPARDVTASDPFAREPRGREHGREERLGPVAQQRPAAHAPSAHSRRPPGQCSGQVEDLAREENSAAERGRAAGVERGAHGGRPLADERAHQMKRGNGDEQQSKRVEGASVSQCAATNSNTPAQSSRPPSPRPDERAIRALPVPGPPPIPGSARPLPHPAGRRRPIVPAAPPEAPTSGRASALLPTRSGGDHGIHQRSGIEPHRIGGGQAGLARRGLAGAPGLRRRSCRTC